MKAVWRSTRRTERRVDLAGMPCWQLRVPTSVPCWTCRRAGPATGWLATALAAPGQMPEVPRSVPKCPGVPPCPGFGGPRRQGNGVRAPWPANASLSTRGSPPWPARGSCARKRLVAPVARKHLVDRAKLAPFFQNNSTTPRQRTAAGESLFFQAWQWAKACGHDGPYVACCRLHYAGGNLPALSFHIHTVCCGHMPLPRPVLAA